MMVELHPTTVNFIESQSRDGSPKIELGQLYSLLRLAVIRRERNSPSLRETNRANYYKSVVLHLSLLFSITLEIR